MPVDPCERFMRAERLPPLRFPQGGQEKVHPFSEMRLVYRAASSRALSKIWRRLAVIATRLLTSIKISEACFTYKQDARRLRLSVARRGRRKAANRMRKKATRSKMQVPRSLNSYGKIPKVAYSSQRKLFSSVSQGLLLGRTTAFHKQGRR
eukprot:6202842-Pleurochrysis_carterae.AAC.6